MGQGTVLNLKRLFISCELVLLDQLPVGRSVLDRTIQQKGLYISRGKLDVGDVDCVTKGQDKLLRKCSCRKMRNFKL